MGIEKEALTGLFDKINKKEIRNKKLIITVSILPIIAAVILLYYFSNKIWQAKEEITKLKEQVHLMDNLIASNNRKIDSLNNIYHFLEFNFTKDFGWRPNDLVSKDSEKIRISRIAHLKIINLLSEQKVNIKTIIRYYTKVSDQGTVENTLLKSGFRNINIFNTDYFFKTPTNMINYSPDADNETIKLIAFALLRCGLDLKAIEPYPQKYRKYSINDSISVKQIFKDHSIEISGNKEYLNKKNITLEDIENFEKKS